MPAIVELADKYGVKYDTDNPVPVSTTIDTTGLASETTLSEVASNTAALVTAAESTAPVNTYPKPATMTNGVTAAMTGTTSTQVLAAPGASLHNYVTAVVISNTHATVDTEVALQDGNGGTTLAVFPAAADYGGCALALPTPLKQPTANTALYAVNLTTGASTKVTVIGYTAAA